MFVIFLMGTKYLEPFLDGLIESDVTGRLLSAAVIIGMMIPFAAIMNGSVNDALMTKLWLKHRANRLPLLTLKGMRIMLSACFIALVLRNIFHIPFGLIVIIAAVPIAMVAQLGLYEGKNDRSGDAVPFQLLRKDTGEGEEGARDQGELRVAQRIPSGS